MKVPMKDVFIAEAVRVLQDALSELVRRGAAVSLECQIIGLLFSRIPRP
jgi:hypothetical protein